MDEMEWNSLVLEVNEYLAADSELDASLRQVVELNLEVGQNNESERETVKNSLKAILKAVMEHLSVVVKRAAFPLPLAWLLTAFVELWSLRLLTSIMPIRLLRRFPSNTPSLAVGSMSPVKITPLHRQSVSETS